MTTTEQAAPEITCSWHGGDPLYRDYHDGEWGRPVADDRRLFEKLCLEGFQAGLSWLTILRKRENFRAAFAGFDVRKVAGFDDAAVARLLGDPGIVRHEGKIRSTINNARRVIEHFPEPGALGAFVWSFEPDPASRPPTVTPEFLRAATQSAESARLSKALKARGFTFVGPTTLYAFMQAMGLVNDHVAGCEAGRRAGAERLNFTPPDARGGSVGNPPH